MTKEQKKALSLVLELAEQNIIDSDDNPKEHKRQRQSCDIVARLINDN